MSTDDDGTGNNRSGLIYYWDLFRLWCSGKMDSDDSLKKDHLLAKRMFYCGCLALPWLWIVNVLYFRIRVYGPLPWWDKEKDETHSNGAFNSTHHRQDTTESTARTVADEESNQAAADQQNPLEMEELQKWVHRSALGALSMTSLFIAWTLIFQLNKSSFSDGWFVMSPDDVVISGW